MSIGYVPPPRPYASVKRRPPPRRSSGRRAFWVGFVLGYFGTALILAMAIFTFYLLFPPARLNVLLIGMDRRPGESAVARTDTLIIATVDPTRPYVGMLSLPRDLWVVLPDGSENRINTPHFFAEAEVAGSGPMAAVNTVASNFGLTLNKYVRIDFAGFVRIIDSVGGITVEVEHPIVDYQYPTYDYGIQTISFEPGLQHMDGERALQFARTRHSSSDFDRAARQQLVIAAFVKRLLEPDAWPRFPALFTAVATSVDTNLSPADMVSALPTLLLVGPDKIERRVVEGNLVQPFTTSGGASVQLPVWEAINPVLLEMFGE
jgi:polyisoprenyl-teichoic acid--peptidoglycan teichoic acid transferase